MSITTFQSIELAQFFKEEEKDGIKEVNWSKSNEVWSLDILEFCLYESMAEKIPQLFNPRFELLLFSIVWDFGGFWKVVPDKIIQQMDDYKLHFIGHNIKCIRKKNLNLFKTLSIKGATNVLMFLLEDKEEKIVIRELRKLLVQSDLYKLYRTMRLSPLKAVEINLSEVLNRLIDKVTLYMEHAEVFCFPILNGMWKEEDFQEHAFSKIEQSDFMIEFSFSKS